MTPVERRTSLVIDVVLIIFIILLSVVWGLVLPPFGWIMPIIPLPFALISLYMDLTAKVNHGKVEE